MEQTINFNEGYAVLSLDQLEQTIRLELATGGLPKNRPIEHFQFIRNCLEKVNNAIASANTVVSDYTVELEPIHINEKHAKRILWTGEKNQCPIDKYHVERLVTRIVIKDPKDKELSQAIAISYNENGITIAVGVNVWVCRNMSIFGGNLSSTYGSGKIPYDKLWELFNHWCNNLFSIWASDIKMVKSLMEIKIDRKMADELIGRLIRKAVLQNFGEKMAAPLNVTQVCRFIEDGALILKNEEFDNFSAWDFINHMTSILKPDTTDMGTMWQSNYAVNQFVADSFNLKYENPLN